VKGRGNIFLADAIQAMSALEISDRATMHEVLRMLSLDRLETGTATSLGGAWAPSSVAPPRVPAPAPTTSSVTTAEPAHAVPPTGQRAVGVRQIRAPEANAEPPGWLVDVTPPARPAGATLAGPPPQPLFPRRQTRGLLTAALSTWNSDGPLDVARVVEMLARVEPIRELPLERISSVRRGVQVLVDTGMAMSPYRADIDGLVGAIGDVMAEDQFTQRYFAGCPTRGCVAFGQVEMKRWAPPPRGTPVLVFGDLGIGRPPDIEERASVEEWLDFADQAATAGCRVVAMVPYGPRRWPRALTRAMQIVHWDRRTTAAIVRRGLSMTARMTR
jgi:hypothetical protein